MTKTYNTDGKLEDKGPAGWTNQRGLSRKVYIPHRHPNSVSKAETSEQRIFASVKDSLERLQLDYIDVLQCHRFDKETPIEETMQALHDLVQAGLVRYIGMSSCWAWQFQLMQSERLFFTRSEDSPGDTLPCHRLRSILSMPP